MKVAKAEDIRPYVPLRRLFDYQGAIAALAIRKRKFALFERCGLGKTLQILEYARHVRKVLPKGKRTLIVSPLMVVRQTLHECRDWYGRLLPIEQVPANRLKGWLAGEKLEFTPSGNAIGITNYEALTDDLKQGDLGALILDESSVMKSAYGKWGNTLLRLGCGLDWKLCATGTPAPNDRIEFATTAVFLDAFPTVNSFLARFFVNRGQTCERWELKPHALRPFYRALSHWCIFLENPATYGWKDNCDTIPPIETHIHDVPMTPEQRDAVFAETGMLTSDCPGGITKRSVLARIGKGIWRGKEIPTNKREFIRNLVDSWPGESTLIWCKYNAEQDALEKVFPGAASLKGETPYLEREKAVEAFKAGTIPTLLSKAEVLGFGLNLQIVRRQVFSACEDSWEKYHQCVMRSNRVGSKWPLHVHLPVVECERPQMETVLRKAKRVEADTREQELLFKEMGYVEV